MSLPWYKCYPRDFNDGMVGLTLEERGAYVTIINTIYYKGGPVEDDAGYWRAVFACSAKAWAKVRAALLVKRRLYAITVNGLPCLMDERAATEIADTGARRQGFSEAGKHGNAVRWGDSSKNNGLGIANPTPRRSEKIADTDTEAYTEEPPHPPLGGASELAFKRAFDAYPQSGKASTTPSKAQAAWEQAAKDTDPEDLVSAVTDFAVSDFAREGGGRRVPSFHRWLAERRYLAWLKTSTTSTFLGPEDFRRAVIAEKGEGWAKSWLDQCGWRDIPERALVPRTDLAAERIGRELRPLLATFGIVVGRRDAA